MSRLFFNIILCFVLIHASHAQKHDFKTGKPITKTYYTQIPYENVRGKIIIPVTINNTVYRFLFDTGAPNLISSTLAEAINSNNNTTISVNDANNNKQRMGLTTIPLLTIGGVSFKNSSALVFDDNNNLVFNCFNVDGIIGTNLLRKSVVQILPKENQIIFTNNYRKLQLDKNKAIAMDLKGNQSSPYISISIKGDKNAKENALIDTGASGFYDMCKTTFNTLKEHQVVKSFASGSGTSSLGLFGSSEAQTQHLVNIPTITIANHDFKNITTETSSDTNSRIGSDILKYGNMTLDFKHKQFYFSPFNTESDVTESYFGFTPTIQDNTLIVGIVWDDTLKDKISPGDEILKVDDTDFSELNICELVTRNSPFKAQDLIKLTVKTSSGDIKTLSLKKQQINP